MADRPASTPPLDRVFDVLRAQDRRRVLCHLAASDRDRAVSLRETIPEGRDPVAYRTRMRHTHVPKLETHGYVEYDDEADEFRPGPEFDEIAPVVETLVANREALPCECPL